jgi:hypothetical protein
VELENQNNQTDSKPGRGGRRPGAGRKPATAMPAHMWIRLERRLAKCSQAFFTNKVIREIIQKDPERFLMAVILERLNAQTRAGARLGVGVMGESGQVTQFVLDLTEDRGSQEALERRVLEELREGMAGGRTFEGAAS